MTRTFKEIALSIGLDVENKNAPVQRKVWFAYQDGKAVRCETLEEAKKYKLYESIKDPEDQAKLNAFWASRNVLQDEAALIQRQEIRAEYSEMEKELFDLCYDYAAYKVRAHSDYEEIPDTFKSVAVLAHKAMNLALGKPNTDESQSMELDLGDSQDEITRTREDDEPLTSEEAHQVS